MWPQSSFATDLDSSTSARTHVHAAERMHAIVRRKYGTPDVLAYEEIARPVPGDEDVLVRVHAAGASIGD